MRQKRGLSASDLAKTVGVSRQTIYAIEAGSYVPNTVVAIRLARILETTVEGLFPLPDDETAPQSEMRLTTRPASGACAAEEVWARTTTGVLVVTMPIDELKLLPLDHRAGYLLSWMDGSIDLETLVEVSALPREEALRIVRDLIDAGVVICR